MGLLSPLLDTGTVTSNAAFKYLWFNWSVVGINPSESKRVLYVVYAICANLMFTISFPGTMLFNLLFIDELQLIISNLSKSITFFIAVIKQMMLLYYRSQLKAVADILPALDKRCNKHAADRAHILRGINVSYRFYYFYMIYYNTMVMGFALVALKTHSPVYDCWFPRFSESEDNNYWILFAYHLASQTFAVFQEVNNDVYPMCYLTIMIAHLRALSERLSRIGTDAKYTENDNYKELLKCIQDHKNILRYFACIRPVISTTLFLQFIMTGFLLCLIGIKFLLFNQDTSEMVSNGWYFFAVLLETFPCCYNVNLMCTESEELRTAIYRSKWYEQNIKFRKVMIIFMQRTQRENIIYAGGILSITLQTFLSILKFSFSMYTILRKVDIN